ncbi:MAG: hypothetical protein IBX40_04610 [Methanosarcinales archaeon]|nr:hypothetical protein [Methanosarcinales archaeon]
MQFINNWQNHSIRGVQIEDIRHQFNIPGDIPILPTVATNKQGVYEAFEILVEVITAAKEVKEFL